MSRNERVRSVLATAAVVLCACALVLAACGEDEDPATAQECVERLTFVANDLDPTDTDSVEVFTDERAEINADCREVSQQDKDEYASDHPELFATLPPEVIDYLSTTSTQATTTSTTTSATSD